MFDGLAHEIALGIAHHRVRYHDFPWFCNTLQCAKKKFFFPGSVSVLKVQMLLLLLLLFVAICKTFV